MKILGIYDSSGPKYHRILLPLSLMPDVEFKFVKYPDGEMLTWADIVFYNRGIGKSVGATIPEFMVYAKENYGCKFICDLDDHWNLDPSHILNDHYDFHGISKMIAEYTFHADCVLVTNERLYDAAKILNENVHILPNAIPHVGQFAFPKTESDLVRLFWAGSITHEKDIGILKYPIKRFNIFPVKMVMCSATSIKSINSDFTGSANISNPT